ncbi:MAG TPA: RNA 2'-phosphotransferase [Flavobacterium sp.]|jgi:putative RNA 2'-phosphotransferase
MITDKQVTDISKFLSLVLRHHPEKIGIDIDHRGWTDVQELLEKVNKHGIQIDIDLLRYVVATNSKKRFAFNDTGDKIRASQGHSLDVELGYTVQTPPAILYHGTSEKSVQSILRMGIEKRTRQHVHLSNDIETALKVGQRHGKPIVFRVFSGKMHADGFQFYLSENRVWLTDHVPSGFLQPEDDITSRNGI